MRGAALVIPAIVLLAGCGTDPASLEGSEDALKEAGSSRIEMRISGGAPNWSFSGEGSMDYANNRGEFVLTGKGPADDVHVIFDGRDAYFGTTLLGKLRWQKTSDYEATGTDRFMPGPGASSPDQVLALLRKLSTKVEMVGDEKVRDVSTSHYRAHLDPTKLGDEEPAFDGEVVVDAWVDGDGLVRRLRVPLSPDGALMSVIDLFDFGVDVDVQPPSAGEIVSDDEFFRLFDQECGRQLREKNVVSQLCAVMTDSGTGYGPTATMPRRVTDGK